MHLVLYQPEIPPNTGNVARLCAGLDVPLHLVGPLGFSLEDKYLRRAGLDYWPRVRLTVHENWAEFLARLAEAGGGRLVLTSARAGTVLHDFAFAPDDWLVLGPETRGLPEALFRAHPHRVRIPVTDNVRSLNLSTAAGIVLYEALRLTGGLPD
ncbi:MAG: tRNA (cytidine(34)-2'-O)-methyltransferase [Desulfovibrionaceae bacterium]